MKIMTQRGWGRWPYSLLFILTALSLTTRAASPLNARKTTLFTRSWMFFLGNVPNGQNPTLDDSQWRVLDLPHDWSIEGQFSKDNPSTPGGGALPGGIGWYRKTFTVPESDKGRLTFIDFDGVYRNSEVWINGHYLGKRPYGYSSFQYELTPFLNYGSKNNVLAVKVDNSQQPNSRWYSGSGIYRNVWLATTEKLYVDHWGTCITKPHVTETSATVSVKTRIRNALQKDQFISLKTLIVDNTGKNVADVTSQSVVSKDSICEIVQELVISKPALWTVDDPCVYTAVTTIECIRQVCDNYETPFGIRTFVFDPAKGFFLNGKQTKIKGVSNHHDLGCLGAAVNLRALERQLEILKAMGVNGIRTSHNPPAPVLLDLCVFKTILTRFKKY